MTETYYIYSIYPSTIRMFKQSFLGLIASLFLIASSFAEEVSTYQINAGDVLYIGVWKEAELQVETAVRPDGWLSFPLIGDIKAQGQTIEALRQQVNQKLNKYIPDPAVTVTVKQLNGSRVYVIGKVNKPGVYPINQQVDVVQVLAMAGGITPYAASGSIKILRRANGEQNIYPFDYSDIEDGENLEQNRILQSGDVVIVP